MSNLATMAHGLWQHYALGLNSGLARTINIDPMVSNTLGKEGITFIVERYQSMIGAPVEVFGGPGRAVRIRPQYLPNGPTHGTGNSKGNSKKVKIARPPNAFILYRQHHHAEAVSQNPSIHNNQISVILGKQWQNESAEVKAKFRLMAEDIKKKHLHANPDYQYQPRRPTEKKRRMTRTKLGKMRAGDIASTETTYEESNIDVDLATASFEETSTGNAVFKMGENDIDGVALAAAVDKTTATRIFSRPPTPQSCR
ncbi:MAG: hypothetical protein Q9228_000278 [Teloschistes exilis]